MCDTKTITNNLVEAARLLVKDSELKEVMGKAGRNTIKSGGFFSREKKHVSKTGSGQSNGLVALQKIQIQVNHHTCPSWEVCVK